MGSKQDLINQVASMHPGLAKSTVQSVVDAIFEKIPEIVRDTGKLSIRNFGTFCVKQMGPRTFHDIKTRENRVLPSRRVPRFTPSSMLKDYIKDSNGVDDVADGDDGNNEPSMPKAIDKN